MAHGSDRRAEEQRRKRRSSSDVEDDRLEEILAQHQQRNVTNWGDPASGSSSSRRSAASRSERRRGNEPQPRSSGPGKYAAIGREADNELGNAHASDFEEGEFNDSFHFDTEGDRARAVPYIPRDEKKASKPASTEQKEQNGLLLPENVLVDEVSSNHAAEEQAAPEPPIDAAETDDRDIGEDHEGEIGNFVELDAGRGGPSARYYEAEEYEQRKAFEECPTCGEKGHDKKSCPHLQCLACGALDDHGTRDCRQGVSCFRCGKLGHKSQECHATRKQAMPGRGARDCVRCGSMRHNHSACPYLWRVYSFNAPDAFEEARKAKWRELKQANGVNNGAQRQLGSHHVGGFNYRSDASDSEEDGQVDNRNDSSSSTPPSGWDPVERWCYNCAAQGDHWGDDCPLPRCNPVRPSGDHSAYSEVMAQYGPLARQYAAPTARRPPRQAMPYPSSQLDYIDNFQAGPHASMHVFDPPSGPRGQSSRRNESSARPPMRQHEYRSKRERRQDDVQRAQPNALEARLSRNEPQHGKSREHKTFKDRSDTYIRPRERKRMRDDDFSSSRYSNDKHGKNRRAPSPTPSLDSTQGSRRKHRRHRHRT